MNTKLKLIAPTVLAALLLASCSGNATDKKTPEPAKSSPSAAATASGAASAKTEKPSESASAAESLPPGVKRIDENPASASGHNEGDLDMLHIGVVYFQPVDLKHGNGQMPAAGKTDMHFEVDIKTNDKAKNVGLEPDQFLPYLKIHAKLINNKDKSIGYEGELMPMLANDGPHYGNNIKLPKGSYTIELTIPSPGDVFMLHNGKDSSAVKQDKFWDKPLKFDQIKDFEWDGRQL